MELLCLVLFSSVQQMSNKKWHFSPSPVSSSHGSASPSMQIIDDTKSYVPPTAQDITTALARAQSPRRSPRRQRFSFPHTPPSPAPENARRQRNTRLRTGSPPPAFSMYGDPRLPVLSPPRSRSPTFPFNPDTGHLYSTGSPSRSPVGRSASVGSASVGSPVRSPMGRSSSSVRSPVGRSPPPSPPLSVRLVGPPSPTARRGILLDRHSLRNRGNRRVSFWDDPNYVLQFSPVEEYNPDNPSTPPQQIISRPRVPPKTVRKKPSKKGG
jgi:hypothetical protein